MPESRPGRGLSDGARAFFLLAPTRGAAAARELLGDYDGVVMADRYAVYEALEKARTRNGGIQQILFVNDAEIVLPTPDYTLVACWMHARRGFIQAARHGEVEANTALDLIAALYALESKAAQRVAALEDPAARAVALREARREVRVAESRPLIEKLRTWADDQKPREGAPPSSARSDG